MVDKWFLRAIGVCFEMIELFGDLAFDFFVIINVLERLFFFDRDAEFESCIKIAKELVHGFGVDVEVKVFGLNVSVPLLLYPEVLAWLPSQASSMKGVDFLLLHAPGDIGPVVEDEYLPRR